MQKRSGFLLIAAGLVLAAVAAFAVIGIARQAAAASQAQIRQVYVVVARRDLLDQAQITAPDLEVKAFPADFAPPGAYSAPDDLIGKYAQGFLPKGQIVVAGQAKSAPLTPNISDRIPVGYVVMWLPLPPVLAGTNILKPGDHVDLLLTAPMPSGSDKASPSGDRAGLSTQTTLQNIEIYRFGDDELDVPSTAPAVTDNRTGLGAAKQTPSNKQTVGLLVDHQNAVVMKFVKDSCGTLDLVTRSVDDQQLVHTDGVTLDTLAEQFRFRVPTSKTIGA